MEGECRDAHEEENYKKGLKTAQLPNSNDKEGALKHRKGKSEETKKVAVKRQKKRIGERITKGNSKGGILRGHLGKKRIR